MNEPKNIQSEIPAKGLSEAQLRCLVSPVRADLFEALRLAGKASIAELADSMARSPHSLYYHVKMMVKNDLFKVVGTRRVVARDEAVYEVVAPRLGFLRGNQSPVYREQIIKTLRLSLRKAEREHQAAQSAAAAGNLDDEEIRMLRLQLRLSGPDAETLRRKLTELGQWARKREKKSGDLYSVTGLVTPVLSGK